jgi:hypothetical protein
MNIESPGKPIIIEYKDSLSSVSLSSDSTSLFVKGSELTNYVTVITTAVASNKISFWAKTENFDTFYLDNLLLIDLNSGNLNPNGSFESGYSNWGGNWGNPKIIAGKLDGDSAAMIPFSGWGNGISQSFGAKSTNKYLISFKAKMNMTSLGAPLKIEYKDSTNTSGSSISSDYLSLMVKGSEWTNYLAVVTTPTGTNRISFWAGEGNADTLYLDAISVIDLKSENSNPNGSFEKGFSDWGGNWGAPKIIASKLDGDSAAMIPFSGWGNGISQSFAANASKSYLISFLSKVNAASTGAPIKIEFKNSSAGGESISHDYTIVTKSKDWTKQAIVVTTPANTNIISIWAGEGNSDTLYLDALSVTELNFSNIPTGLYSKHKTLLPISMYPNPVSDILNVNMESRASIQVLDITGKTLIFKASANQKEKIDMSSLKSGIYFIKVKTDDAQFVQKIIKK